MSEAVEKIVEKISVYELINNLIPGAVYITLMERITSFRLGVNSVLGEIVLYYFAGVVIARIGSLSLDNKLIKKWYKVVKMPASDYIRAEMLDKDGKITTLSAVSNMYRSFMATAFCLMITVIADIVWCTMSHNRVVKSIIYICSCLILLLLFSKSYKKQTGHVVNRVKEVLSVDSFKDRRSA